jgi:hypothetical protein
MCEIVKLSNSKICMFSGDQTAPQFHLKGSGWTASIEITSLEFLKGSAPRSALIEAVQWALVPENLALLASEWRRLNERE